MPRKTKSRVPFPVNEAAAPTQIKWVNRGGPFRKANGEVIGRGKVFYADLHEIPEAFRDVIKPVDPIPDKAKLKVEPPTYKLKEREDDDYLGMFDITDGRGKVINEAPLEKTEAEAFLKRLQE